MDTETKREIQAMSIHEDPWPMSKQLKILLFYNTLMTIGTWVFLYVFLVALGVLPI